MSVGLRYHPDDDQVALAAELDAPLTSLLPIERGFGSESEAVWRQLDQLGILSAGLDEAGGGSGLGATEQALIAMTLGRRLASPAVLTSMAAAAAATSLAGANGAARICAAFPGVGAPWVDERGAPLALRRDSAQCSIHAVPLSSAVVDDTMWGVRLVAGDLGPPLAVLDQRQMLLLRLLDASALAGIAEATLDMAVDYAKLREQFGRAIGSFQAVKHHCATMAIAARSAHDLVTFAAAAIDQGRHDAVHCTESAFLVSAVAAIENAGMNIQIHGGIGFSAEAAPHLFLKRAQLLTALAGGHEAAADRVAAASLCATAMAARQGTA